MAIQQKLQTRLAQKLILTPSLQQAIKLLPMSTLELADLLNQEIVENPLLEEIPTEDLQAVEPQAAEKEEKKQEPKNDTWDDQDYEYFFGEYLDDGYRPKAPTEVKELPPIENTLSTSGSLTDHLSWQLTIQTDDEQLREIGEAIIGNLDDDGYLVASVDEIAHMGPWPIEQVERALKLLQGFDPIGVCARDLQECLTLQLRHIGLEGTPTEKIVTEYLRLLQNHQVPELAKRLGCTIDDLKEHIEVIKHLDPKPGSRYNPKQSQYVIPDVYIVKVEDQYVAVLIEEGLPQLRISPTYRRLLDMKCVFHSVVSSSYGDAVSSVTIKQRIRKIIESEDPKKPLSVSKSVSILQREGLMLARRTIAKYREELKIPTSNQRKVMF